MPSSTAEGDSPGIGFQRPEKPTRFLRVNSEITEKRRVEEERAGNGVKRDFILQFKIPTPVQFSLASGCGVVGARARRKSLL